MKHKRTPQSQNESTTSRERAAMPGDGARRDAETTSARGREGQGGLDDDARSTGALQRSDADTSWQPESGSGVRDDIDEGSCCDRGDGIDVSDSADVNVDDNDAHVEPDHPTRSPWN